MFWTDSEITLMSGVIALVLWISIAFGAAMGLYFGLRAVKLI
jgi:hypothetical protein